MDVQAMSALRSRMRHRQTGTKEQSTELSGTVEHSSTAEVRPGEEMSQRRQPALYRDLDHGPASMRCRPILISEGEWQFSDPH